jgi:hypothetical protein
MPELESPVWELPFPLPSLLTPAFPNSGLADDSSPFIVMPER